MIEFSWEFHATNENFKRMKRNLLLVLIFGVLAVSAIAQEKLPNIVYIMVDDMGIGDVSVYNPDSKIKTPNIDQLAKQGLLFTDAHTAAAVCTPTRYGLITGRYCWRSPLKERVISGYDPCLIPKERETVATLLKRNGYSTALVGKWHLGLNWTCKQGEYIKGIKNDLGETEDKIDFSNPIQHGPTHVGFDYYFGIAASWDMPPYIFIENDKLVEKPGEKIGGWVGFVTEGKSLKDVTNNDSVPKQAWRKGYSGSLKPDEAIQVITDKTVEYIQNVSTEKPFFLLVTYAAPHTPVVPGKEFRGKSACGLYGDFCQELDQGIGAIVQSLKELKLSENTMIVFTADNGASLKAIPPGAQKKYDHSPSYNLSGFKARLTEGGHRVPYIVSWPGHTPQGLESDELICLNDLYATCAALVDEKVKDNAAEDSYNILPILKGEKMMSNAERIVIHSDAGGYFGIRYKNWKLSFPRNKRPVLNDLATDITEENNLYEEHPEMVQKLTAMLTDAIMQGRTTQGLKQNNVEPKSWEQLYWLNEK
ncbi:arylsulfatase [Labilibacter sediminis]|nr:arylsulfatase [Labilibacter sediminis]